MKKLLAIVLLAACGSPSVSHPIEDHRPVQADKLAPLALELQVLTARGTVMVRIDGDDAWRPLAQGASLAGVRDVQVTRQGAVLAIGHGDAAGRVWLRAGTVLAFAQDDRGVHLDVRGGRARVRREASALPLFAGGQAVTGDFLVEQNDVIATGARPELVDWSLALERPEEGLGVGRMVAKVEGASDEPLALRRVSVEVHTSGDYAVTEVEHVFFNAADRSREGTFRFPVPEGAILVGMAMEVNGKLVEGEIVEREKAREVYDQIVDQMMDPALLEWEEGNWFKLRVFPVEAKAEKRVIIRYASPLVHAPKGWEYDFALAKPDAALPIGDLTVKVDGKLVDHETTVTAGLDLAVDLGADRVPASMIEQRKDGVYTAVRIAAPKGLAAGAQGPRRIAIVVDTSRSALETKQLAEELVRSALGELNAADRFVVLASDVAVTAHAAGFVGVSPEAIDGALAFLDKIEPDGASDLAGALEAAGKLSPTDVIYVGDGIPTWGKRDDKQLAAAADAVKAPIHAALLGKGANGALWDELAGRTGGRAIAVHRSADAQRFALAATHAADVPRLTGARITGPEGTTIFPGHAMTIYQGDELVAFVRSDKPLRSLTLTGLNGTKAFTQTIDVNKAVATDRIGQRWASYQLAALELASAPREDIVKMSQDFGLMSRYTSLLVLENDEAYKKYQIERKQQEMALKVAQGPTVTGGDLDSLGAQHASLSPDEIQPGDPEIKIPAPREAHSVVVVFPFGETKLAVWDDETNAWMVRFLIDKDTPDGVYQARVTITHADGRIEVLSLPYTVDTQAPAVQLIGHSHGDRLPDQGEPDHHRQEGRGRCGSAAAGWHDPDADAEGLGTLRGHVGDLGARRAGDAAGGRPRPRAQPGDAGAGGSVIALLAVAAFTDVGEARTCLPLEHGALIGTGGGLVAMNDDGSLGRVWTSLDGLPGTRIETIAELDGQIWIGTDAGGARFADGRLLDAFPSRDVRGFAKLGRTLYAATWDGGVIAVGGAAIQFRGEPFKGPRTRVAAIAVAGGVLYAGTAGGLYKLERGTLVKVDAQPVVALLGDGDTLWEATQDGLIAGAAHIAGGDLRAIAKIDGQIVVGGLDGLQRVDRGRLVGWTGPRELHVTESLASAHGATCAGGLAGAWLRRGDTWIHGAHRDGPPSNDISALAVDGERLLVGTFDHGLAVYDHGWRTFESPDLDARINTILVDGDRTYIGTAEGLSVIHGKEVARLTRRDGLPGRNVLALAKAAGGILVGTSQGAVLLGDAHPVRLGPKAPAGSGQNIDPTAPRLRGAAGPAKVRASESIGNVWAIAEDTAGWLWLGTTTGLYRGHAGDATWMRFAGITGALQSDWVTAIAVRGEQIFVGTYSGGIVRIDGTAATQLAPGWVNPGGLVFVGDTLYAATQDGLQIVGGGEVGKLPGRDTTALARLDGTLVVGTRRGVAVLK